MLADDDRGRFLRVAGAAGSLEPLIGQVTEDPDTALVRFAMQRERIEVAQGVNLPTVNLIGGTMVRSAAVAPLRSQGVTMGALAVADRQGGPFTTEDLWLLSTVATNASVVLANGRLYEIVRRSKEEWETAFNALAEGIAVVGPGDAVLRANRALAALAEMPESELVGRSFTETLLGTSEPVAQLIDVVAPGRADGAGRDPPGAHRAGPAHHRRPLRRAGRTGWSCWSRTSPSSASWRRSSSRTTRWRPSASSSPAWPTSSTTR